MSSPFLDDNDQTRARREHLEQIRELVGNAYPNKFRRSNVVASLEGEDSITAAVRHFKKHEPAVEAGARPSAEQLENANTTLNRTTVRISGRIATPPRVMGKAAFVHLSDGRERLQIYIRKQDVAAISNDTGKPIDDFESGWKLLQLLDHGDFVGVEGFLFVTKTGELSVHVQEIEFLSKALVPMPDKLHGISDPEIRQRQRYADLIAGSLKVERDGEHDEQEHALSTRDVFERRSKLITHLRRYLDDHGYVEVETPMLSPIASGASARPFKTHHNALDIDLYLRIAPELYLKRLVVGGFERVYELNRNFRNEGIAYRWNPEFTMLEFYCAYMDAEGMMNFAEEMLRRSVQAVSDIGAIRWGDQKIDLASSFARRSMKQAIVEHWPDALGAETGVALDPRRLEDDREVQYLATWLHDWHELERDGLEAQKANAEARAKMASEFRQRAERFDAATPIAPDHGEAIDRAQLIAEIFEFVAEAKLVQPTFITDFPKSISPLSKASPENPSVAERFELYIAGMEIANGFSELNDPVEQHERFLEQTEQRERGDEEAMQMDLDYVRALSYGMPPAAGIGIGIDRLMMLLTNRRSIRDVILFPHMRPRRQAEDESAAE
jgi:lysyl-tRNA synthetase class 2